MTFAPFRSRLRALRRDRRGIAMVEFGLSLPLLVTLGCAGLDMVNYVITRMRVSQVALQLADNAARMGDAVQGVKTVTEAHIAETFAGGQLQSGTLDLDTNGRVVLSSLEPKTNPNAATPKYRIVWQRCYGDQTFTSSYGVQGATDLDGMGPTGRLVTAQDYDATMFVEVYYKYQPFFPRMFTASTDIREIAAMAVRDPRVLGVQPTSTGTAATC